MSKIKIEVCELCRKEDCNGRLFRVPESNSLSTQGYYKNARWCEQDNGINVDVKGTIYLRILGHGILGLELEEVKNGSKI